LRRLPSSLHGGSYTARHATAVAPGTALAAVGAPVALATAVSAGAPGWSTYRVQPGDTLFEIAQSRNTSVEAIARANAITNPHFVRDGRVLRIASGGKAAAARQSKPSVRRVTVLVKHTVRPGDNVIRIAKRYKVSPGAVAAANRLRPPYLVRIGSTVKVPVVRTVTTATQGSRSRTRTSTTTARHTVRAGDTLSGLAARYGSSVSALASLNGLRAPYVLFVGKSVIVRKGTGSTTGSTGKPRPASERTFAGRTYSEAVVAAADRARARIRSRNQPSSAQIRSMITATARKHGVDPALALAISMQESGWDQGQVSVAGAIGAMQIMPGTGEWMSDVVGRRLDIERAQDNITAGVVLLRWLQARTSDDRDAIAAYYQGLGNVQRYGHFRDTKQYVANVVALRNRYS
jgi:LysM repeat protein